MREIKANAGMEVWPRDLETARLVTIAPKILLEWLATMTCG